MGLLIFLSAVVAAQTPQIEDEPPLDRGLISVHYSPGLSVPISFEQGIGPAALVQSPGVELRISRWFLLRADAELRPGAQTFHLPGIKLSGMPLSRVHPWVSLSLAITHADANPHRLGVGLTKAYGLDVTIFKYFFITAEFRVMVVPGDCCSLPRVSGLFGGGVQFL